MKILSLAVAGLILAIHGPAQAATTSFKFHGSGISGALVLTYGAATDAKYPEAYQVTGISGTFSDSNNGLGIVDAPVGPLVPVNHAAPEPTNLLAPDNFSKFAVASGLDPVNQGFLSYDNLVWPGGSPQTASDYPFHGGLLDIYGLMFEIGDGRIVNFWSNGIFDGGSPDYGAAVATPAMALDYVGGISVAPVPLPAPLALLVGGLLALVPWRRRKVAL